MAKYTDAIRDTIISNFNAGDQPTEAQFTNWITRVQEGIEEHTHAGGGDGTGLANLVGPVGIGGAPAGTLDVYGEIRFSAHDVFAADVAQLYTDAAGGLIITGQTGAGTDLVIAGAAGGSLIENPTGSSDVVIAIGAVGRLGVGKVPAFKFDLLVDAPNLLAGVFFNDGNNINRFGLGIRCGEDNQAASTNIFLLCYNGADVLLGGVRCVNNVIGVYSTSDESLKTNVEPLEGGLEKIRATRPVEFNWKENKKGPRVRGFVAQELQEVIPEAVSESPDGNLGVGLASLIPYLVAAVQEQQAQIDELRR